MVVLIQEDKKMQVRIHFVDGFKFTYIMKNNIKNVCRRYAVSSLRLLSLQRLKALKADRR